MLSVNEKKEIVAKFGKDQNDTGSVQVQVAILTAEIAQLNEHNKANIHDFSAKRSLVAKVAQRRSLLAYLKRTNLEAYAKLVADLGLRA
jgi:small subunit ribosomal protein S15